MELIDQYKNNTSLPIPNMIENFITDSFLDDPAAVSAVFCLVFYNDEVLFTTEADIGHPDIDIPGGHIEKDETFEQALYRELQEETGIIPFKTNLVAFCRYTVDESALPVDYSYSNPSYILYYVGYVTEKKIGNKHSLWMSVDEAIKKVPWVSEYRKLFETMHQQVKYLRGDFEKTYLDVYDETGEHTIGVKSYDEVHRQGLWHKGVHVWFLNSQNQFLVQKRSGLVQTNPNLLENTIGGHIDSGYTSIEAALSECKEELGITLEPNDFEFVGTIVDQFKDRAGTVENNEFDDIYIVRKNVLIEDILFSKKEVSEVVYIDAKEYLERGLASDPSIVIRPQEYALLLKYLYE